MNVGDAAALSDARHHVTGYGHSTLNDQLVWHYTPVGYPILDDLRTFLYRDTEARCARRYTPDHPAWPLIAKAGALFAGIARLPTADVALAHRDNALAYHRDTQNPGPCVNATVFFRGHCHGGWLVLPDLDVAFACEDAHLLIFDGQQLHGVTPLEREHGGSRVALTYYLPTGTPTQVPAREAVEA